MSENTPLWNLSFWVTENLKISAENCFLETVGKPESFFLKVVEDQTMKRGGNHIFFMVYSDIHNSF